MDTLPRARCRRRFLFAHRVPLEQSDRSTIAKYLRQAEIENGGDRLQRVEPMRTRTNGYKAHHGWYVWYPWRRRALVHFVPTGEPERRNEVETAEIGHGVAGNGRQRDRIPERNHMTWLDCLCQGASPLRPIDIEPVLANLPGELMPLDTEQSCRLALIIGCVPQCPADVLALHFSDGQPNAVA